MTQGVNFREKKKPMHFIILTGKPRCYNIFTLKFKDKLNHQRSKRVSAYRKNGIPPK
jgi:hypothetical protein